MDVKKFFSRRSQGGQGTSRLRRRSKGPQSNVAPPQDDPLTSAYTQTQQTSTSNIGPAADKQQPQGTQTGTAEHNVNASGVQTQKSMTPREPTDKSSYPLLGEDPASISKKKATVSDAHAQHARTLQDVSAASPIADEFSSASYYMRQNSPPPSLGRRDGPSIRSDAQSSPPTTPRSQGASYDAQSPSTPHSGPKRASLLERKPVMVGQTAAAGTRNAPSYVQQFGTTDSHSRQTSGAETTMSLPYRGRVASNETRTTAGSSNPTSTTHVPSTSTQTTSPPATATDSSVNIPRSSTADEPEIIQGPSQYNTDRSLLVSGASEPPSLDGVVDLQNTSETIVHTRHEPAVYHDQIRPEVHHVTHEQKQRDVHTHEIHHRVLPIKDVQVLPAKHYAPLGPNGELVEIDESQIPGREGNNQEWMVDEKGTLFLQDRNAQSNVAQSLHDRDGAEKKYMSRDGVPTTETTYVHPPQFASGQVMESGSTASGVEQPHGVAAHRSANVGHATRPEHERRAEEAVARQTPSSAEGVRSSTASARHASGSSGRDVDNDADAAVLAARRAANIPSHPVPGSRGV